MHPHRIPGYRSAYDLGMSEVFQTWDGGRPGAASRATVEDGSLAAGDHAGVDAGECGVSIYAAQMAHSAALLAFGSDSFVELLSASLVLAQCIPGVSIAERRANRVAGGLLFLLAVMVAAMAMPRWFCG